MSEQGFLYLAFKPYVLQQLFFCAIVSFFLLSSCQSQKDYTEQSESFKEINDHSMYLWDTERYDEAIRYMDSASRIDPPVTRYDHILYHRFIVSKHQIRDQVAPAEAHCDSVISLAKDHPGIYSLELINSYFSKGDLALKRNDLVSAIRFYFEGKNLVFKYLNPCDQTFYLAKISEILYKQQNYRQSIDYGIEAFESGLECPKDDNFYFIYRQTSLNTIGLCYEKLGEFDQAIHYYLKGLAFIDSMSLTLTERKHDLNDARGVFYGNLGNSYALDGQYDLGMECILRSKELLRHRDNYEVTMLYNEIKLANLFLAKGDYDSCVRSIEKVNEMSKQYSNDPEIDLRVRKLLWEYEHKVGDIERAYALHMDYVIAKEKSLQYNQQLKEVDFVVEMTRLQRESEIIDLKKANQLKNTYLIAALAIGALSLMIVYLLWYNRKNTESNTNNTNLLNEKLKRQNNVLVKSLEALESSHQENTRLLKIVAHDLRNPLAAIVNICQLLEDDFIPKEEQKELISMIQSSSLSSIEFIRDLLNINTDGSDMQKDMVPLDKVILDCKKIIEHKALEKNQKIHLRLQPVQVMANREKLWRVLSNLMTNAIKFSPNNSTITVNLSRADDGSILFSVADQGIGIPPEWKDKIFTVNQDIKRLGTNGEASFGLGLLISKQIVEAHGGSIWFESQPGERTVFYISFPEKMSVPEEEAVV